MFYAHFVLAKKGPLARIWLAAHWDKKLTKAHVFETNIEKSVDGILQPKVKMALRTSGHLLLGVVRIYSRKAKYLLADCNEAFVKIKMAFRPGMVDLPEDIREAAVSAITLPEVFHDFDTAMTELNDVDIQNQFTLNQSRAEEITMREDYGNISLVTGDDGFGDMGFEEPPELMRDATSVNQSLEHPNLIFGDSGAAVEKEKDSLNKEQDSRLSAARANTSALDLEAPIRDDGFGGNLGQDIIAGGLFDGSLFEDGPMGEGPSLDTAEQEKPEKAGEESDDEIADLERFSEPPSLGPPSTEGGSRSPSPVPDADQPPPPVPAAEEPPAVEEPENIASTANDETLAGHEQTTLLHNEEESFALAPVDASAIKSGWPRAKRKRKLIVDEVKNISGEEMKAQLSDTTDIVTTLDLAPPTKRLMHWKETGGVEKLFALPGRPIHARSLSRSYQRHLTSEPVQNEDFGMAGDKELENLSLEQVRDIEDPEAPLPKTRLRQLKRKYPDGEEDEEPSIAGKVAEHDMMIPQQEQIDPAQPVPEQVPVEEQVPEPLPREEPEPMQVSVEAPAPESVEAEAAAAAQVQDQGQTENQVPTQDPAQVQDPAQIQDPAEAEYPPQAQDTAQAQDVDQAQDQSQAPAQDQVQTQDSSQVQAQEQTPTRPPGPVQHHVQIQEPVRTAEVEEQPEYAESAHNQSAGSVTYDQPAGHMENMGYDASHPPPTTPGAMSEGGPRSVYSERAVSPTTPYREEEHETEHQEEQAEDETYEQFEERVVNKRAGLMFHSIRKKLRTSTIPFSELTVNNTRKQVAQKFYTMLVLKKLQAVELTQDGAFTELYLSRGHLFDNASL